MENNVELGKEIHETAIVAEAVEPITEHPEKNKCEEQYRGEAQRVVRALLDLTALGIIEWRVGRRERESWARACVGVHLRKDEYPDGTDFFMWVANEHRLDNCGHVEASQIYLNSIEYGELVDGINRDILDKYDYDVYNESE